MLITFDIQIWFLFSVDLISKFGSHLQHTCRHLFTAVKKCYFLSEYFARLNFFYEEGLIIKYLHEDFTYFKSDGL